MSLFKKSNMQPLKQLITLLNVCLSYTGPTTKQASANSTATVWQAT